MAYTPELQQLYLEVNFSFSSYIFAKKTKTFSTLVEINAKAIKCTIHIIYAKILIIFTQFYDPYQNNKYFKYIIVFTIIH